MAHWRAVAPAEDQAQIAWIVVRHEIDYKRSARMGDEILARTWVGEASRIRFERHTEVLRAADRAVLAKARTVWVPIDIRTRKPAAVSAAVRAGFSARRDSPAEST